MNVKATHTPVKLLLHEPVCNGYRVVHIHWFSGFLWGVAASGGL